MSMRELAVSGHGARGLECDVGMERKQDEQDGQDNVPQIEPPFNSISVSKNGRVKREPVLHKA